MMKKSLLQKVLEKHKSSFFDWKKTCSYSRDTEECIFEKGKVRIVFQEDLREHVVNMSIIHPQKRVANVKFRELIFCADDLDSKDLIAFLKSSCYGEASEISAYVSFLKKNQIIR